MSVHANASPAASLWLLQGKDTQTAADAPQIAVLPTEPA
jgi:hypothetical protein